MNGGQLGGLFGALFVVAGSAAWIGVLITQWFQRRNTQATVEKTKAEQEKIRAEASEIFNNIATKQTEQINELLHEERRENARIRAEAAALRSEVEHLREEVTALRLQLEKDAAERRENGGR